MSRRLWSERSLYDVIKVTVPGKKKIHQPSATRTMGAVQWEWYLAKIYLFSEDMSCHVMRLVSE